MIAQYLRISVHVRVRVRVCVQAQLQERFIDAVDGRTGLLTGANHQTLHATAHT